MKTILLSTAWVISWLSAMAQLPSAGPWHVARTQVRVGRNTLRADSSGFGDFDEGGWGVPARPAADTATVVRMQRTLSKVTWDVNPATITLLRGCENPLLAPPAGAGIRFAATGATLRSDPARRQLLLVPTGPVVLLRAYRGRRQLFAHSFQVADAPMPTVKCYYSSGESYRCRPAGNIYLATLSMRALPNADFASFLPTDVRYRVARFSAELLRRGQVVAAVAIKGAQVDLSGWRSISQPGDSLRASVLKLERQNSQLVVKPVPMPAPISFTMLYQAQEAVAADTASRR